jgi:hypothetical protein
MEILEARLIAEWEAQMADIAAEAAVVDAELLELEHPSSAPICPSAPPAVHLQKTNSTEVCCICTDRLPELSEGANIASMCCGHSVHTVCLVNMVLTMNGRTLTCPVCRRAQATEVVVAEEPVAKRARPIARTN